MEREVSHGATATPEGAVGTLRAALLLGLGVLDLGFVGHWLVDAGATPRGAIPGFPSWLALRALVAVLVVGAVDFTRRRGGHGAGDDRRLALNLAVGAWCFALPGFGEAIACIVTWPVAEERPETPAAWQLWPAPVRWDNQNLKIAPPARHDEPEEVAGDLLLFDRAHDGRRLQALLRAARLPLRFQVPLARHALGDANDDVRLFAFSLIDRRRRDHERAVQLGRAALELATTPAARAHAHLRLAELAWESAYHGLHDGSALRETLATALEQVDRALVIHPDDPSAHALRGRILLRLERPDVADVALRRALELKHPAVKVLPYLAEGAFQNRQFAEVREHLSRLHILDDVEGPILGRLRAIMEHWL